MKKTFLTVCFILFIAAPLMISYYFNAPQWQTEKYMEMGFIEIEDNNSIIKSAVNTFTEVVSIKLKSLGEDLDSYNEIVKGDKVEIGCYYKGEFKTVKATYIGYLTNEGTHYVTLKIPLREEKIFKISDSSVQDINVVK